MLDLIIQKTSAFDSAALLGNLRLNNPNFSSANSYTDIITSRINTGIAVASEIAALVAFIILIVSGFQYMTAGGNAETSKKAMKGILYSVIGLIIVTLSWVILSALLALLS